MELRVATTRGTNALLEGKGDEFALVLNEGMKDILRIGDQSRRDLFALAESSRLTRRDLHSRNDIPTRP